MADWNKKVRRALRDELRPGEDVISTVFLQPLDTTTAVARGAGGAPGAAAADRLAGGPTPSSDPDRLAASLPDETTVLVMTTQRLVALGHNGLTGRPMGILTVLARNDLESVDVEAGRASSTVVLHLADGSSAVYAAPRLGNDADGFALHVNGG